MDANPDTADHPLIELPIMAHLPDNQHQNIHEAKPPG